MSVVIKIENLSKQYKLGLVSTRTLSHDLNRWWQTSILGKEDPYLKISEINSTSNKGESEYIWALKDNTEGFRTHCSSMRLPSIYQHPGFGPLKTPLLLIP